METFLERQPSKIEEIRRLVTAELLGKFDELKYPSGDSCVRLILRYPKKRKKNGKKTGLLLEETWY